MMQVSLIDNNVKLVETVIDDISKAKHFVFIEIYRLTSDSVGERITQVLIDRAEAGVTIHLLVDAFGSATFTKHAERILAAGGDVRFFKKIRLFFLSTFKKNNSRNHRKIINIDNKIVYIGSSNLTAYSHSWRELNLRMQADVRFDNFFKKLFQKSFAYHRRYDLEFFERVKPAVYMNLRFIQDIPSLMYQNIRNHFLYLIRNANTEIVIETPYFVPDFLTRRALINAVQKRGVRVKLIIPLASDLAAADLVRNRHLGSLHQAGVEILYFEPDNLHAKCILVDQSRFSLGSANFDYRSFRFQFEIMMSGTHAPIVELLKAHIAETERQCVPFNYETWMKRKLSDRVFEFLISPFRRLF